MQGYWFHTNVVFSLSASTRGCIAGYPTSWVDPAFCLPTSDGQRIMYLPVAPERKPQLPRYCFSEAGLAGQLKQTSLPPLRHPYHSQKLARKLMVSTTDVNVPAKQDTSHGASANYCTSLGLVASVISKDRCCPTLIFSLIPAASTQPLLVFCAVVAPFLPTFIMDSHCT